MATKIIRVSKKMALRLEQYKNSCNARGEKLSLIKASERFADSAITTYDDINNFFSAMKKHKLGGKK